MRPACVRVILLLLGLLVATPAWADVYARVLTQDAQVRTGPGARFRTMHVAHQGDVLAVRERGTREFWLRVEMEDGTTGWIHGEQVSPFEVALQPSEPGFFSRVWSGTKSAVFGPSPLNDRGVDVELSFQAGLLGGEGLFLLRGAWVVDPHVSIDVYGGQSPQAQEDLYLAMVGWTLRLLPGGAIGPYVNGGIGLGRFEPKEDAFTLEDKTLLAVSVGGGLELSLKQGIVLRVDGRHWMFFDENEARDAEEVSGGLAIFF